MTDNYRDLIIFLALTASGCEPKEAADPADILGEDSRYAQPEPALGPAPGGATGGRDVPATAAQCEAAARRIEALGVSLAIRDEPDPAKRAELEGQVEEILASAAVRERVQKGTEDCVRRGTTRSEALCIAQVENEAEIDACAR